MAKAAFDPNRNLVVDQFVKLNQAFYSGRPHYYLRQRMYGIVLMCGQSSALAKALEDPVWLGEFGIQGPQLRLPEESTDDYAAMDAVVLFHHAAEALMRLYFAHEGEPPCPWLEVSRIDASGEFKKKVAAFIASLDSPDAEAKIMRTFRGPGAADPANHEGPVGEWMIGRDGLIYFLRRVATLLLDDAPLYNAAKHGLAVLSAPVGARLGRPGEQPVITADGPSLAYLRQPHRREPDPMWAKRRVWVQPDAWLKLAALVINEIESLWSVARARYLGQTDGRVALITPQQVHMIEQDLSRGSTDGIALTELTEPLEYWDVPPSDVS